MSALSTTPIYPATMPSNIILARITSTLQYYASTSKGSHQDQTTAIHISTPGLHDNIMATGMTEEHVLKSLCKYLDNTQRVDIYSLAQALATEMFIQATRNPAPGN